MLRREIRAGKIDFSFSLARYYCEEKMPNGSGGNTSCMMATDEQTQQAWNHGSVRFRARIWCCRANDECI